MCIYIIETENAGGVINGGSESVGNEDIYRNGVGVESVVCSLVLFELGL